MRVLMKIIFAAFLVVFAFTASTAYACGCGIYVPREGDGNVLQERALVRWDGTREDIAMSLGVLGKAKEAAIVVPIPSRADVKLADANLFDVLAELTKPLEREQVEWTLGFGASAMPPEAGAGAPSGVSVLSRQNVGPFDVVNLAATDSAVLKNWLGDNDFQIDAGVIELMQPYVVQNWTFVAVRMRPDQSSQQLSGDLQPLWISFDSDKLVYPMRASANAENSQSLLLYVLADHRIDKLNNFGASRVSYADWLEPANLSDPALAPFLSKKFFLTKFTDTVIPDRVNEDFQFSVAAQDTPFREVTVHYVRQSALPLLLLACFVMIILGMSVFVVLLVMIMRRRAVAA